MDYKNITAVFRYIRHRMGFHNKRCRRRLFTTKDKYICLITGNKHKKFKL